MWWPFEKQFPIASVHPDKGKGRRDTTQQKDDTVSHKIKIIQKQTRVRPKPPKQTRRGTSKVYKSLPLRVGWGSRALCLQRLELAFACPLLLLALTLGHTFLSLIPTDSVREALGVTRDRRGQ